ncbi:universal stress protein [Mycobacterium sp.]|uniref:universal stress protein n=1 Tax=Mycobacterium sp. TaxID=1785 RepID=UPI003C793AFC
MRDQPVRFGIVVGVDGSTSSTAAVQWAAREAAMRNVGLALVHVVAPVAAGSSSIVWTGPNPSVALARQAEHAHQLIDDAVKAANDTAGALQIRRDVIFSSPVPTLVDMSEEAQMLVVGRHGRRLLPHVPLGSTSTAMMHQAHCPVAVIPEDFDGATEVTTAPVLVGIDGSPASELATAIAFGEASWRGVDLVALHASCDSDPFGIHELEWAVGEPRAHEALAERLAGWQERYPDVTVRRIVVFDRPARHLLERVEAAQLVVVGSRGRGGFAGLLLGSVSTAVAQAARIPVIVARQG